MNDPRDAIEARINELEAEFDRLQSLVPYAGARAAMYMNRWELGVQTRRPSRLDAVNPMRI